SLPSQCSELSQNVYQILDLIRQAPNFEPQDTLAVEASLKKAIAPKFEIVFAGAFSAGKSMLINALLERELLYSAEGHATGTECYIEYAEPDADKVVLTFLSEAEIKQQVFSLCQHLELSTKDDITQPEIIDLLHQACAAIIELEGGASKSSRAKKANALSLLLQGFQDNQDRIDATRNNTFSMEEFNFSNLDKAATYARRGSNSAVLTKVEYYCHHPLLEDGNVLVDMPGIDAPVKKDAELTYSKIEHPDTSAVICVLKAAATGEMTSEETELLEKIKSNLGIRDRVFYVFNRIDRTWFVSQLRQRLDDLIATQFQDTKRIYKTSGLLGFYGSQIKSSSSKDRFGLDSIFADSVKGVGGEEETPQFVSEFNNYCTSGKLTRTNFRISVNSYETPNDNYTRILSEFGTPLIEQLITDSGIEEFRSAITRYLTEEKRPQLFINLAEDLRPLCLNLKQHYLQRLQELDSQPDEIESMKTQELVLLNQKLQEIGKEFAQHWSNEVNSVVTNQDSPFEADFLQLRAQMVSRLDELLQTFSVQSAYSRATLSHPRNATAPLIAVLVEALYHLANELEVTLVAASQVLVQNFGQRLRDRIRQQQYYRDLDRLLGEDTGIEQQIAQLETDLIHALVSEAKTECDRYVRESPRFYDEGTFSIYQFRQTLQQTSQGYDCASMVEAEPAIRQLLKLDFEPKVSATIRRNFRQTINQTIKTHLLPMAQQQADKILQYYPQARKVLSHTLEQEAITKIALNQKARLETEQEIELYNQSVSEINNCLQSLQLFEHQLPTIELKQTSTSDMEHQDKLDHIDLVKASDNL
ncbi:MAG: dynamin-like GTPase family protein, partial [Cyanobacteria bacterium P01_A01_bin.83]